MQNFYKGIFLDLDEKSILISLSVGVISLVKDNYNWTSTVSNKFLGSFAGGS